jgi:hypothetical protein
MAKDALSEPPRNCDMAYGYSAAVCAYLKDNPEANRRVRDWNTKDWAMFVMWLFDRENP